MAYIAFGRRHDEAEVGLNECGAGRFPTSDRWLQADPLRGSQRRIGRQPVTGRDAVLDSTTQGGLFVAVPEHGFVTDGDMRNRLFSTRSVVTRQGPDPADLLRVKGP